MEYKLKMGRSQLGMKRCLVGSGTLSKLSSLVLSSCLALVAPLSSLQAQAPSTRTWLSPPELALTVGDGDGVELMLPTGLTAHPLGGFVLGDRGDHSIRAYSASGKPVWAFGRKGGGPGEFMVFKDIEFDLDGDLLVLDSENSRLTVLSGEGSLVETLRLPSSMRMRRILPSFRAGERAFVPTSDTFLWVSVSKNGRIAARADLPQGFEFPSSIIGEAHTTISEGGACIGFRWASPLILLVADGSVSSVLPGVEPVGFPDPVDIPIDLPRFTGVGRRVDPNAIRGTRSISSDNSRVFVLFSGEGDHQHRVVDVYDIGDGGYLGSLPLPNPVAEIAVLADGRLATLENDLIPVVRIWSMTVPHGAPPSH